MTDDSRTTHRQRARFRGRRVRRAFTILELLIVIGIILAIGGLVLVNVLGASEKADKSLVQAQIQAFNRALEQYKVEMKRYPSEEEGLVVLWNKEQVEDEEGGTQLQCPLLVGLVKFAKR